MDSSELYLFYYSSLCLVLIFLIISESFMIFFVFFIPIYWTIIFVSLGLKFDTRADYIIPLFKGVFFYVMLLVNCFYGVKSYESKFHLWNTSTFMTGIFTTETETDYECDCEENDGHISRKFTLNKWYFVFIGILLIALKISVSELNFFDTSPLIALAFIFFSCYSAIRFLISPLLVVKEEYSSGKSNNVELQKSALSKYKVKYDIYISFGDDPNKYMVRDKDTLLSIVGDRNKTFHYVTKTDIFGQVFLSSYPKEEEFTPSKLKSQENLFYSLISKRFNNVVSNIIGTVIILVVMMILFVI